MKLSLFDFMVLIETLRGSLRFHERADGLDAFTYKRELRLDLLERLLTQATRHEGIEIDSEKKP